jgi:predicted metal-dependent phosphoesterase TrpH
LICPAPISLWNKEADLMPAGQPFTSLCKQLALPRCAGRVDLHVHTTASDGDYTPAQIVDLACRSGLSAVAITDHDIVDGIAPARQAAAERLEVIAGVEITAGFRGRELHLLGYFFRPDDKPLNRALEDLRRHRIDRFREMVERLRALGIPLETNVLAGVDDSMVLGRRHLAALLVRCGRAATIGQAFQRYLSDRGRACVPKRCLAVGHAIHLVRGAGGVASWAHPTYDCTEESLLELRGLGLQAVEVDYPSCRPSRRGELQIWARRLGLAVTGGSDCHGPGSPRRALGVCGLGAIELEQLRTRAAT